MAPPVGEEGRFTLFSHLNTTTYIIHTDKSCITISTRFLGVYTSQKEQEE
jgi:hypothetical protein